jgi:hypothetical protein
MDNSLAGASGEKRSGVHHIKRYANGRGDPDTADRERRRRPALFHGIDRLTYTPDRFPRARELALE